MRWQLSRVFRWKRSFLRICLFFFRERLGARDNRANSHRLFSSAIYVLFIGDVVIVVSRMARAYGNRASSHRLFDRWGSTSGPCVSSWTSAGISLPFITILLLPGGVSCVLREPRCRRFLGSPCVGSNIFSSRNSSCVGLLISAFVVLRLCEPMCHTHRRVS